MNLKLEQLEARLQSLIEVSLVSALPGFVVEDIVVQKIARSIKENIVVNEDGTKVVPNVFTLVINPLDAQRWNEPAVIKAIVNSLKTIGKEADLIFSAMPTITIDQNPNAPINQIEVRASHQIITESETHDMTPINEAVNNIKGTELPKDAFLIIDGVKVYALDKSVISIGRRQDNQLVIDDPRVSRNHAQLRAINGRFVIFDLDSTGGTFVNGQRVSQYVLYPGDVISLAGVPLIFGQDSPPTPRDLSKTGPLAPASAERPTAYFKKSDIDLEIKKAKEKRKDNNQE